MRTNEADNVFPLLEPGRGRRRAEDVRRATLAAAADLLFTDGVRNVTFEKVAARAGVSKTTLYKWWASPGSLAFEAYFDALEPVLAFPDTGDIRADLTTQLHAFVGLLRERGQVIAEIIGTAQRDPELAAALAEQYVRPRRRLAVERLSGARRQGLLRADVDPETVVDQLWGACYHRLLMPAQPLTTAFADRLLDNLFGGIAAPGCAPAEAGRG
ncbi:TetR-like C-terminal domain-containing protein [Nocardia sp. alder85J]|uniref:TetR-like C-terminal domain-containing protein n=1 Tax=Nocardia sp. alder85J TaxID=2862949 RepID=UPI001CD64FAC|nr:TetR/AcrR family transcriptional regulator C-terminal ligand-binding domain-containing protein [Nocardia sp. alder85J]MCX4091714.1 TetR/AcrR family transcriptional regulator C-terminal ligand-binding domain-containing protein [Nocardia sp. alder85J]